jgi:hypothetical protein
MPRARKAKNQISKKPSLNYRHLVQQQRKSKEQKAALRAVYPDTEFLEITPESRDEAVKISGLRWD